MNMLEITIAPAQPDTVPAVGIIFADIVYTRSIAGTPADEMSDLPSTIQDTIRIALDNFQGKVTLQDILPQSNIELRFLAGNGSVTLRKTASVGDLKPLTISLTSEDIKTITTSAPKPPPPPVMIERRAFFVTVGDVRYPFERSKLQFAAVTVANNGWKTLGLDRTFHMEMPVTVSIPAGMGQLPNSIVWNSTHLAVDGKFDVGFRKNAGDAWLWWLTGPQSAIGVVMDDLSRARAEPMGIALPPMASSSDDAITNVPANATESELALNPGIYTEDPGEYCKPFSNPERVLGERSFFVTLRVEQPVIGSEATVKAQPLPTLTFDPLADAGGAGAPTTEPVSVVGRVVGAIRAQFGAIVTDNLALRFVRHAIPKPYLEMLRRSNQDRSALDSVRPVQWEGDISRYQATTVARGHIIEYRMRWRSNGYSLGTVAKTLTLAPRQTKRIQKISWERAEISRRSETTQLFDQVEDSVTRQRDYDDTVRAHLSEWSRGESSSSTSAAAGGFGFASVGFVIGGGGGGSSAHSESSQSGGRDTSAAEEQRLRDTVRRYGDALRRLESTVVSEVSQEETVTGTTETVRNQNYAHALTVIYYQILRHLKIDTSVAAVRECLFVPFAILPFTIARAFRWRELISLGLRSPSLKQAIKYLKDVLTNFVSSDVPAGRRSDQPVRYIFGSLFMRIAIERPKDKEDGSFDLDSWVVLRSYLGAPALSIFERLLTIAQAKRDAVFQKDHAPTIAATWVNTLELWVGKPKLGVKLDVDFTLATRYAFNGVVRVDFTAPVSQLITRESMTSLYVAATAPLAPGSVANLTNATYTYETDQYQRRVTIDPNVKDLLNVESGEPDPDGGALHAVPDSWERRDVRKEMTNAVHNLVEHLNEHVEYFHKVIWWNMDRDRLFMLLDGFYVPGSNDVSVASIVERDPIAIIGNSIVFRVSAGAFIGIGNIRTPKDLLDYYISGKAPSEPMLLSLPTDGLYAQTVMDECGALEEHYGNTDWALNDPDPELGSIAPELLASRRAEPAQTTPTQLPQTIINLQNAPEAPAPSGLAGALAAVQNANAFRDMAGLAGTQANAAAALQTAASLATNFGNQAAALKLADIAAKAQATQSADQKVATVQRAVSKGLATPEEGQQHTRKILEGLYSDTPSRPHQDNTISNAIQAASGRAGSTIEAMTPEGQVRVSLAEAAGTLLKAATGSVVTPAVTPAPVEGIDIYEGNSDNETPSSADLQNSGYLFVFHRSNISNRDDKEFSRRWPLLKMDGFIRGSYHPVRAIHPPEDQAAKAATAVRRLVPGDLGPTLDIEDRSPAHNEAHDPGFWVNFAHRYLDAIETALGRQPLIYTSRSYWKEFTGNAPDFVEYPLWVIRIEHPDADPPPVWLHWTFWQWHTEDSKSPMPAPFTARMKNVDLNHFNGTVYELRGLADIGRPGVTMSGTNIYIAHSEIDHHLHLQLGMNGLWTDHNLTGNELPDGGDDPVLVESNGALFLYFRYEGNVIEATASAASSWTWDTTDLSEIAGSKAAHDPRVIFDGDKRYVAFWGDQDNDWYLLTYDGVWSGAAILSAVHLGISTGQPVVYLHQGMVHVVGRADTDGHLVEVWPDGDTWKGEDVTISALATTPATPAATYSPAPYATSAGLFLAYRAIRGDIWLIDRATNIAENLSGPANATHAAGHLSCFVLADVPHIVYRGVDKYIYELWLEAGTWKAQQICEAEAAADPVATTDGTSAVVAVRGADGMLRVAAFNTENMWWTCSTTVEATITQPPSLDNLEDIIDNSEDTILV